MSAIDGPAGGVVRGRRAKPPAECGGCGEVRPPEARGLCKRCYYRWHSRRRRTAAGDAAGDAVLLTDRRWVALAPAAHPDTAPAEIADRQRADVAEALRSLGPGATAEDVSDAVMLPRDVCERRMAELRSGW